MKENYYQKNIKKDLEAQNGEVSKYHATVYGQTGHTDLFCSLPISNLPFPIAVYIEVKTPDGELSLEQRHFIAHKLAAGHLACVAVYIKDVWEYLAQKGIVFKDGKLVCITM